MNNEEKGKPEEAPKATAEGIQIDPRAPEIADRLIALGQSLDPEFKDSVPGRMAVAGLVTIALRVIDVLLPVIVPEIVAAYDEARNPLRGPKAAAENKSA